MPRWVPAPRWPHRRRAPASPIPRHSSMTLLLGWRSGPGGHPRRRRTVTRWRRRGAPTRGGRGATPPPRPHPPCRRRRRFVALLRTEVHRVVPGRAVILVMARKVAFQAFLVSDTLAMCSSLVVAFICIIAKWEDLEFLVYYRSFTKKLMWFAYMATTTAFATGLYTVVAPRVLWLAVTVCILTSLLPILTKLLGEWPILKLRFRLGRKFKSELLDMV